MNWSSSSPRSTGVTSGGPAPPYYQPLADDDDDSNYDSRIASDRRKQYSSVPIEEPQRQLSIGSVTMMEGGGGGGVGKRSGSRVEVVGGGGSSDEEASQRSDSVRRRVMDTGSGRRYQRRFTLNPMIFAKQQRNLRRQSLAQMKLSYYPTDMDRKFPLHSLPIRSLIFMKSAKICIAVVFFKFFNLNNFTDFEMDTIFCLTEIICLTEVRRLNELY